MEAKYFDRANSSEVVNDDSCDEDGSLVFAAQKDPAAFAALYDRWLKPVYQYFLSRTADISRAEDLTSQLFLSVFHFLKRYEHRGHFAAWLFTMARNLANKDYRKQKHEISLEKIDVPDLSSDPADQYDESGDIVRLRKIISRLSRDEQDLVRLRYAAGLSYAEMGLILHKKQDAVKKSLYRLQNRLQSLLEDENE